MLFVAARPSNCKRYACSKELRPDGRGSGLCSSTPCDATLPEYGIVTDASGVTLVPKALQERRVKLALYARSAMQGACRPTEGLVSEIDRLEAQIIAWPQLRRHEPAASYDPGHWSDRSVRYIGGDA